jgi:hypothetical protein
MNKSQAVWRLTALWVVGTVLVLGCGRNSLEQGNPISPFQPEPKREAMYFGNTQLIFGDPPDYPAADVDLATVVWGQNDEGEGLGDIVVFDDDTSWVVAVAIVDDLENEASSPSMRGRVKCVVRE